MTTRDPMDHYATPPGLARAALALLPPPPLAHTVLDSGAGTGVWGQAWRATWQGDSHITGVELDLAHVRPAGYDEWWHVPFADFAAIDRYAYIIGNPPYKLAQEFIEHSYDLLRKGGYLVLLLRLGFLASQKRRAFWDRYPPQHVAVCRPRPSFTPGGTDATEYAIYLWQRGVQSRTTLGWLDWSRA